MSEDSDVPEIPAEVLIVDDDEKIRELLTLWFKAEGYVVHEAPSAEAGLAAIAGKNIAVITVDKDMPEHDGTWLVEQVQKTYPGIAMLLASGDDQIPMRVAMSRGIQGYLVKPFKRTLVTEAVKAAIAWHKVAAKQASAAKKADPLDDWFKGAAARKPDLIPEPEPEPDPKPEPGSDKK